ncbi:hypothetical protein L0Y65_04240 [Candidatus Micrarchaeota archaeon]|nr:hypothetical protein [Candidatus Micrarchaeota archaeon]
MKFTVAKREVDLQPIHVLYVLAILLLFVIALTLAVALATFVLTGGFSMEDFLIIQVDFLGIFSIISTPVLAFLLLRFSGILKMKNNVAFCRSLAASDAVISIGLALLAVLAGFAFGLYTLQELPSAAIALAGNTLSSLAGAIVMYLWLLLILKPDGKRAKETGIKAGIFAIVYFMIHGVIVVLLSHAADDLVAVQLDWENIRFIISNFMFAFPLLYFMKEKEDREAYLLFAGLFIGAELMYGVNTLLADAGGWFWILEIALAIAELGIIYALSKKDILKTF